MDEAVHLQLLKEEYPIPAPKNVPKNVALIEKPDKNNLLTLWEQDFLCKF